MNNNKVEKESEPGEFTNHEDEVRGCVGVGPHLGALPPATVSEAARDRRRSRQEKKIEQNTKTHNVNNNENDKTGTARRETDTC